MIPPNLPDHLKTYLAELRSDMRFHEVMKAVTRTAIKPFPPNTDLEKATTAFVYASGKLAAEKSIMIEVLGYDPTDRTTEQS